VTAMFWSPPFEGVPTRIPAEKLPAYYAAYRALDEIIQENVIEFKLKQGELVVFNQRSEGESAFTMDVGRMLHGREAFESKSDGVRHLQGTYVNIDDFLCRFQSLRHQHDKANTVDKHKAIAALAASQANTLAARQSRRRDEVATLEERLRELASRSDDDAIIGQLQQKLMTIQANYHSFTDRYEKAMELQRAAQLQVNTLTLQMDATSQHLASELEKERQTNRVLESTIATLKQSDLRAKLKRLEAMATRIEALEDDAVQLHAKKRALERRVEELEAGVSTPSTAQTNRSKDSSTQQKAKWRQDNAALQSKLDQTLFEMDALKAKCSKLLTECNDKDAKIRDLAMQVDNLVLESQLNPA
ncbi:hypothetical protein DYB25_011686, partial [Aphanomyces astaci]